MANILTDAHREDIWFALSDAFVDNEINYDYIVRRVEDVDIDQLKDIFFCEVAPYCGVNLMTVIPEVWCVFDRDELIHGIRKKLADAENHLIARWRYKGFVAYCRHHFRDEWQTIADKIAERKAQGINCSTDLK